MRIKHLILNGFKSFPDKTTITFDQTINAIVGPNGCGKTNVLDGLRWVMGEASFSQMRCGKTEDLIFSGNRVHPPDNYAEVALILQNNEESATNNQPLHNLGAEIEVKRRFFRSGESEFSINRKPCKLKDIQDLFTSGGGSGHSYSIFDLPKMRQIISSNLKELFIEAAGLAFYQERKDEIERKLKLTSDDLIRLNDIISERTRITRNLKRQAYRLMAFEKVKEQERKLQVSLLKFDYRKISEDKRVIDDELEKLQTEVSVIEKKITDSENRRAELRKILQEKEDVRNTLQNEIENLKEQVIINEERLKANLDKKNYLKSEQEKLQSEFSFVEQIITNKESFESKKQYLGQIQSLLNTKEQKFEELRRKNKNLEAEIFSNQLALDEMSEKDKQIFIRFSQLSTEIAVNETKIEDTKRYQQNLEDSIAALISAKTERATIKEYKNLVQDRFGGNFIGLVKELITVQPGYERALESVLYGLYDAVVVNSFSGISPDIFPQNQQWTIISQIVKTSARDLQKTTGIGKSFSKVLEFKPELPDYVKSIIDSFILVDNYGQILSAHSALSDYSFVTKSGVVLTNTGLLIIPSMTSSDTSATGTDNSIDEKIQALFKEKEIITSRKQELEQSLLKLVEEKKAKEQEKEIITLSVRQKQEAVNQKRKLNKENLEIASNLLFDLNKRMEEVTQIKAELDYITAEFSRSESRKDSLFSDRGRLTQIIDELKNEENCLRNNIIDLQKKLQSKKTSFDTTQIGQLSKEYDDLETTITASRIGLDILKKNISEKQLHKFEVLTNVENIERKVAALLPNGLDLLKVADAEEHNIDDIKRELSLVQKRIAVIGLINPLAKDDYDREKTALDKLTNQRVDIITAQNNLDLAINQLTKKAEEMFLETYKQVQVSFRRIFEEIFIEGEADLILATPGTPLDSEIRIIAQPKGKVPKRLDQLSDGEKALLALSLLFAFYDIKPAPFCFMDEVDAPLDDANVKRFSQFLKRISQTTQVIIITHNKLTVEAASVVIGVTTEEPGISKIVSVRFKDLPLTQSQRVEVH